MASNEIPGMDGLCWSDLPLTPEEIEDLQEAAIFPLDDLYATEQWGDPDPDGDHADGFPWRDDEDV